MPEQLAFTPAQADAGTSISVSDTLANVGTSAAVGPRVGVYLSTDAVVTTADRLLGSRTIPRLERGERATGGGSMTIPANLAAGTYWIGAIADDLATIAESSETNNVRVATATLTVRPAQLPDLEPVSISATPLAVVAGGPIDVSDTVRNTGVVAAGAFQVAVYLSQDATVTTQDVLLGVRPVASLASGASSSAGDTLAIPPTTTAGTWWVGVVVDAQGQVGESDEADNVRVAANPVQVSVPPRPNLVVQSFTFTPASIDSGLSIDVSDTVANVGPGAAIGFDVEVFLSTDANVTRDDVSLGFRSLAALASGASDTGGGALTIPIETAGGTYWLGAIADSELVVPEVNEADNVLVATSSIVVTVPPRPDLVPEALSFTPSTADTTLGTVLTVNTTVRNVGVVPATAFRAGVYLSANNVVSTSDVLLASRDVAGLAVGESSTAPISATVPAGLGAGTYFVGVVVDDLQSQFELRESNNALLAPGMLDVIASPLPQPDLVVQTASYTPHSLLPGGSVQVVNEVRNQGTLSSAAFQVGIYLSTDDVIATDDVRIGSRTVFQLGINFGSASSAPYTVPATLAPGTYYLGVVADDQAQVAELAEANNALRASGTLVVVAPPVPEPDLVLDAASFTPGSAAPGETLNLEATARNQGDLDAGAFRVAFYASTDDVVDAQDVLLGYQTVSALATNESFVGVFGVQVPASLAPGTYTVGAIVDDVQLVTEGSESNNTRLATGTLTIP
ncbi:MAG: hypothetical protein IPJ77_11735 [Planctomycetes bacterium]|nr:hypothetical protein [Planctomycetota bacterium]